MLGQAEIEELGLAIGHDADIRRFQIAVHELVAMRFLERRGYLVHDVAGLGYRNGAMVDDIFLEVLARHIFHDQVMQGRRIEARVGRGPRIDCGHDVWMLQPRDGANFRVEPAEDALVAIIRRREDFNRDRLAQADVFRFENNAHRACAEPFQHSIIVDDEPKCFASGDTVGLELRQQILVEQLRHEVLHVGRLVQRGSLDVGQLFIVFECDDGTREQLLERSRRGNGKVNATHNGAAAVGETRSSSVRSKTRKCYKIEPSLSNRLHKYLLVHHNKHDFE